MVTNMYAHFIFHLPEDALLYALGALHGKTRWILQMHIVSFYLEDPLMGPSSKVV